MKQEIWSQVRVERLPKRCLLVWLTKVATRAKGGCRRRCCEHGALKDLQRWQKIENFSRSYVYCQMLVVCAAFFGCWLHHWLGHGCAADASVLMFIFASFGGVTG